MLRLALKKTFGNWVNMSDEKDETQIKFRLDYPTQEQEQKLQDIMGAGTEITIASMMKYKQHYIKYTVKDWTGFDIPCKLVNNELENDLWWALVKEPSQTNDIYTKIYVELDFNSTDKKKLESADTSGIKEN